MFAYYLSKISTIFVIPQNVLFAFGQNAHLCGIPFIFLAGKKPNGIPDKIAFLQERAKKRFFRNDGIFERW